MKQSILEIITYARLQSLPRLACRAAGLNAWNRRDFLPAISADNRACLQAIARSVRAKDETPTAIFIHGVLPRSGTNLLSDVLSLHPDTVQNPGRLWEFPLLRVADGADALEREFKFLFPPNSEVMPTHTIITLLAQGWMRSLHDGAGCKCMVLKAPHMQNIGLFDAIFPDEKLFLILRDGRDVVASSLASFSKNPFMRKGFSALCHEWALASDAAIETAQRLQSQAMLLRYEDLARLDPSYTESLLHHAGLNPQTYPWHRLKDLPIRGSSELGIQGEVNWKQQAKPENFNPVGRWNQWPDRLKQKFRAIAGKALIQAGYESASEW